jgi:GPH family glycoside/pentoside/hexuronide:cation symporter
VHDPIYAVYPILVSSKSDRIICCGKGTVLIKKLPFSTKIFWGFGQIGEGVKNAAFASYLLFYYNQILGVSATLTALALAIAVFFDAITDPLAGSVSDKFESRWGRRHPFMFASAAPLGITLFLLFSPPADMSEIFYFVWVLFFAVAVRTFLTLYHVPHLALGAEIAPDYEDRNTLFGTGLFFGAFGGYGFIFLMLALVFTPQPDLPNGLYNAAGYPIMAGTAGVIAFLAIMLCVWGTRKEIPKMSKVVPATEPLSPGRLFRELKVAFSSPSYRSIFFGLMLGTVVTSVEGTLQAFMGVHFWGLETTELKWIPLTIAAGLPFGAVLGAYLVRFMDKKWCLIVPAALTTINVNVLIVLRLLGVLPENGDPLILQLLLINVFISAIIAPSIFITINSMFADISDEIELMTGRRQEGIIYSARAFAAKAAVALGTIVGGIILDVIQFPENAVPGEVSAEVVFNLGFAQGPGTSIFSFLGLLLYFRYRLSRQRHQEILAELDRKRAFEH